MLIYEFFFCLEGGEKVDTGTQTPRDDDGAKHEVEVTVDDGEATGAAPYNVEQDDKKGRNRHSLNNKTKLKHKTNQIC